MAAAGTILPGVSVGGVELSGLSPAAAAERLDAELPSSATGHAVVVVGEDEAIVEYEELGRGYETQAMVDAAFGIGRNGNPLADGLERLRSLANPPHCRSWFTPMTATHSAASPPRSPTASPLRRSMPP